MHQSNNTDIQLLPPYHIIVFGATSFVGQLITQYLYEQYGVAGSLQWAIAGRSESKLTTLRDSLGSSAATLPILVADAQSESELKSLCQQTHVMLSTVGPYALYGDFLVKACVETGTDYCDLTGEVQWVKLMIDRYETLAQQTGARIVHCCGYDSIPSDMGVYFLQQQAQKRFDEHCSTVKMRVKKAKGGVSGGTIASMMNIVKEVSKDTQLRKVLVNPYSICPPAEYSRPKQKSIMSVSYDDDAKSWMCPFVMAGVNEKVVQRSNALLQYHKNFTYNEAMLTGKGMSGYGTALGVTSALGGFMMGAAVTPIRGLVERFLPKPGEGPRPEDQRKGFFVHEVYGITESGQKLKVKVTGDRDPGYGSTAKMISQAAMALAFDMPKADKAGGFYTPAAFFGDVLLERLQKFSGLTFEVSP